MAKRFSTVQGKHLKPGLKLWLSWFNLEYDKRVATQVMVLSVSKASRTPSMEVMVLPKGVLRNYEKRKIYLGDKGIRPFNYDNRVPQIFSTKRMCVKQIKLWDGRNPNFLTLSKKGKLVDKWNSYAKNVRNQEQDYRFLLT